jgi:DNA-binding MarR family transcriptional regulator
MAEKFFDPQQSLGFMAYTANRLLMASLKKQMAKEGLDLTAEQWALLFHFWNNGAITPEELVIVSGTDKSTVSRTLKIMDRKGLITKSLDPKDSRRKILSLTKAADELKTRSLLAVEATASKAMTGVDPGECAVCLKVLSQVKQNLLDSSVS